MPRNQNAPQLEAEDLMEGTTKVAQGRYDGVIDFTRAPKALIADGTECELEIKQAKSGYTQAGFPKVSIMYVIDGGDGGDYDGEAFWDDLLFIPPMPPKKGTMWRVHAFADAIAYELPEQLSGEAIHEWIREFAESMLGERLRAVVGVQVGTQTNPKTDKPYEPRNTIKRFIPHNSRSLDDLFSN